MVKLDPTGTTKSPLMIRIKMGLESELSRFKSTGVEPCSTRRPLKASAREKKVPEGTERATALWRLLVSRMFTLVPMGPTAVRESTHSPLKSDTPLPSIGLPCDPRLPSCLPSADTEPWIWPAATLPDTPANPTPPIVWTNIGPSKLNCMSIPEVKLALLPPTVLLSPAFDDSFSCRNVTG